MSVGESKAPRRSENASLLRLQAAIEADIDRLLRGSKGRFLRGIEADGHDFKLLPDVVFQFFEAVQQAVQDKRAKHRAIVINKRQDDWFLAEILTEPDFTPGFVSKHEIERYLIVQFLINSNIAEDGWRTVGIRRGP